MKSELKNNPYITPVNIAIVSINVIVYLIYEIIGDTLDGYFMLTHGAMYPYAIFEPREWYRLVACAFLHFGLPHLINNMIMLIGLGSYLERTMGKVKYIIFYIVCAIGSSVISAFWHLRTGEMIVSAGASGVVFSVIGALLFLVIRYRGKFEDLTMRRFLIMLGLSLYYGFSTQGIDNAAHVGGLFVGFVFGVIFLWRKRPFYKG